MLKPFEFLKHFRVLIPQAPLKNLTTGQCTRRINSAENKTYSGPKTVFNVSDEVPHVGKIDELLTVSPTLNLLRAHVHNLISHHSVREMESMS